jgi:hypothetical protein
MKVLMWVVGVVVALAVLGALLGGPEEDQAQDRAATADTDQAATEQATPEPTPEPLNVAFNAPSHTTKDQVKLRGTVDVAGTDVFVAGRPAKVRGKRWEATIAIKKKGDNRYKVVAVKPGHPRDRTTAVVTRTLSAAERAAQREAERQAFMAMATSLDYDQLAKNPNRHKGTKVVFRGQIFQIQEDFGQTWMLLSVTDEGYGFWDDNVWVEYDGTIRGAEEDIITVYGTIKGEQSYETQIGGETYVPKMRARYVVE